MMKAMEHIQCMLLVCNPLMQDDAQLLPDEIIALMAAGGPCAITHSVHMVPHLSVKTAAA